LFLTFVTQMVAFRLGTEALAKLGNSSTRPHVHVIGHPGHVQEQDRIAASGRRNGSEDETARADSLEKGEEGTTADDDDEEAFLDASEKNPVVAQVRNYPQSCCVNQQKAETAFVRCGNRLWASRRSSLEFAYTRSLSD
jgi:hypothetical protein